MSNNYSAGALNTGGKWEQFSDGSGGTLRLEWRVDLQAPSLTLLGGRPDSSAKINDEHGTLSQLAVLQP
jgi:hypothetical protein